MTLTTPKSLRLHFGLYGRRNVGKSSVLNAITNSQLAIVSEVAGTTTDPVEKAMELPPLGPVLLIDTAGLDDEGTLGSLRIKKTYDTLSRIDLGLIVIEPKKWSSLEDQLLQKLVDLKIPLIVIINKVDLAKPAPKVINKLKALNLTYVCFSATKKLGIEKLCQAILAIAPKNFLDHSGIIGDLIAPQETVLQIIPIDQAAPKGRLLLPQQQLLRELLELQAISVIIKETEIKSALAKLAELPKLVVTDSSIFGLVAKQLPKDLWLTGYSILFARAKGELITQAAAASKINQLPQGASILICEACTHHPTGDDLARVKIPRLLQQFVGHDLNFTIVSGKEFPENLSTYQLVVHCGACMLNRQEMLSRILRCQKSGVPITNFGLLLGQINGILERALLPFPEALHAYLNAKNQSSSR
jgi:hydrogenase maturation GTPase HydF